MANEKMTVVFDVDDVLCDNRNRDYKNAIPIHENIAKVNGLARRGYKIVLHTARGMVSCGGNVAAADVKNRATLEKWLEDNGVYYDELVFGKPIAMLYVDDKCMTPDELKLEEFYDMHGGSRKSVMRMGKYVKKTLGDDVYMLQSWYNDKEELDVDVLAPKIVSYTYDEVVMEYVQGLRMCDHRVIVGSDMDAMLRAVDKMRGAKLLGCKFDMQKHVDILRKNEGYSSFIDGAIDDLIPRLWAIASKVESTFSHGDMTFSNMIMNGGVWLIDPRYDVECTSYLLDLAKMRMSMNGFEHALGIASCGVAEVAWNKYHSYVGKDEFKVGLLECMFILRLVRYNVDHLEAIESLYKRVYDDVMCASKGE